MILVEKGYGCGDLMDWLVVEVFVGLWFYLEDQVVDLFMCMIVVEIICEKLMLCLYEEIFYQLMVEIEVWEEKKDGSVCVDQIVYVVCFGYKGIVLGKGGEIIKVVGQVVCVEMVEFMGCNVYLFLQVKVCENWFEEFECYSEMGLDFCDGDV